MKLMFIFNFGELLTQDVRNGNADSVSVFDDRDAFITDIEAANDDTSESTSTENLAYVLIEEMSDPDESEHQAFFENAFEAYFAGEFPISPSEERSREVIDDGESD